MLRTVEDFVSHAAAVLAMASNITGMRLVGVPNHYFGSIQYSWGS